MTEDLLEDTYISTRKAAEILNLSVATIQKMVEENKLVAWKTAGGHRRVLKSSVDQLLHSRDPKKTNGKVIVYVVEDDPITASLYLSTMNTWNLPIEVILCTTAFECVYKLSVTTPDLIISDLKMDKMDGFELVTFIKSNPVYKNILTIVVTGMEVQKALEALPSNVTVFSKPIPFHEIHGYVNAVCNIKRPSIDVI
jgi:excisionase family DNA binding protein